MSDPVYETVSKAKRQEDSGNPKAAAETLESFLMKNPMCIPPRLELARLYIYKLDDRDFGMTQLDVILDMDPDNVDALKASTTVRMTNKKYRERVDDEYSRLVGLVAGRNDPKEYAQVCAAYAVFLRKQMIDFPKSEKYYQLAIHARPDAYEYHQDYAVLLLNDLKNYPKAKEELETVLRLRPNSISAKKNLDLLMKTRYDKDGNLKKEGFFSRFRHRSPKKSSILDRVREHSLQSGELSMNPSRTVGSGPKSRVSWATAFVSSSRSRRYVSARAASFSPVV